MIFWDTNIFIYMIEGDPRFLPRVVQIWTRMKERGDRLCTSALTVGEALVTPVRLGDEDLQLAYRSRFRSPAIRILDFNTECSERYAALRAASRVRRSDAIQLACAAQARVDLFVTNDQALTRMHVEGIQFISSLDTCPI